MDTSDSELLYTDTDSVFLKRSGATFEDFVSEDILARETGLLITLETCYKFLVLLPLEADEKLDFRYQLTAIGAPGPNLYIARGDFRHN